MTGRVHSMSSDIRDNRDKERDYNRDKGGVLSMSGGIRGKMDNGN